jgi:Protein of Unknown function (DUF2784)
MLVVLADAVVTTHILFLAYVVFGGFLLLWRGWPVWPYAAVTAWSGAVLLFSIKCPLTILEVFLRERAGQNGYSEPFVEHYFEGVLYPASYPSLARLVAVLIVAAAYLVIVQQRLIGAPGAEASRADDR